MKIIVVTLHLCLIFYWAASEDPNNLFKQRFIRAGADTAVAGGKETFVIKQLKPI
jgi:hypothetical protein